MLFTNGQNLVKNRRKSISEKCFKIALSQDKREIREKEPDITPAKSVPVNIKTVTRPDLHVSGKVQLLKMVFLTK